MEWGVGRGCPLHTGKGLYPSPKSFDFGSEYGEFWCILGGIFTVQLPVLHAKCYNLVPFHIIFILFFFASDNIIVIITVNNVKYLQQEIELSFTDMLSTCQLHISLTRTAQIYLQLHFCVQLHTKKAVQTSLNTDVFWGCDTFVTVWFYAPYKVSLLTYLRKLLPVKQGRCSVTGKSTAGLEDSNDSPLIPL